MTPNTTGRGTLFRSFAALLAALTIALLAAAPAVAATDHPINGKWLATVYRSDGEVERDLPFKFNTDGTLDMVNMEGERCHGTWRRTGVSEYTFDFTQPIRDDQGNQIGYIEVHQDAVVTSARTFTSQGWGKGYLMDGTLIAQNTSKIEAHRY